MAGWSCPTSPTPSGGLAVTEVQGKLLVAAAKEALKGGPDGLREIVCTVLRKVLEAGMATRPARPRASAPARGSPAARATTAVA
jgi:hypothetical protein